MATVENALGAMHGLSPEDIRVQLWRNLRALVAETLVGRLLPNEIRGHLAAA